MKLFKTASSDTVQEFETNTSTQRMFGVKPVTDLVLDQKGKFLIKLVDCCDNAVCVAVSGLARAELDSLNPSYVLIVCLLFICTFLYFF